MLWIHPKHIQEPKERGDMYMKCIQREHEVHFMSFLGGFACQFLHVSPFFTCRMGRGTASETTKLCSLLICYGLDLWREQIFSLALPNDWKAVEGFPFEKNYQVLHPQIFKCCVRLLLFGFCSMLSFCYIYI